MEKSSTKDSTFQDSWFKSQSDFFESWTEATEKFQKAFKDKDWTECFTTDPGELLTVYTCWKKMFDKYFDTMIKNFSFGISKDTVSKLFSGADAYMKLYEFWDPLIKAFQEKPFEPGFYEDLLDPSKYKEMIDKIFGFSSPKTLTEFYGQASKLIETWGSKGDIFVRPWTDAMQKNIDAYIQLASGEPEASMRVFDNLYSAFESTFGKAFKLPAIGKDREGIELLLKTIDRYSVFLARNVEFQHVINKTGEEAMEKVIEATAQKTIQNEGITTFDGFFNLWTTINEKAFLELFKTDSFSRLQGSLLDVALDARRHFQKLTELYLRDFPIALRSEMDDIYRTVYTLNRNVRELMRKGSVLDEMHKEIADLRKKVAMLEKKKPSTGRIKRKSVQEVAR